MGGSMLYAYIYVCVCVVCFFFQSFVRAPFLMWTASIGSTMATTMMTTSVWNRKYWNIQDVEKKKGANTNYIFIYTMRFWGQSGPFTARSWHDFCDGRKFAKLIFRKKICRKFAMSSHERTVQQVVMNVVSSIDYLRECAFLGRISWHFGLILPTRLRNSAKMAMVWDVAPEDFYVWLDGKTNRLFC